MTDFNLDTEFMSRLSQIANIEANFLHSAKNIIEGDSDITSQKKELLALGQTSNTVLNLDENETELSTKCFKATDVGNLDAHTVLGIIDSQDLSLEDFLQTLRVEAFQSDHFLSNMAESFYTVLGRNLEKNLYDFLQTVSMMNA